MSENCILGLIEAVEAKFSLKTTGNSNNELDLTPDPKAAWPTPTTDTRSTRGFLWFRYIAAE